MATDASLSSFPAHGSETPRADGSSQLDQRILAQLERTRRHVKLVDIATWGLVIGTFALSVCLIFAWIDHGWWDIGRWGRWCGASCFWGGLLTLLIVGGLRVRGTVNPLFAAQVVEEAYPGFKNSLISFLQLRVHRSHVRAAVLQGMQRQAAEDLSQVDAVQAVDHTPLIRWGYLFAGLVLTCCLYGIFSPKSFPQSVGRMLFPWWEVMRPASVVIEEILPGDATVRHGDTLSVQIKILGRVADSDVFVEVWSTDGQMKLRRVAGVRQENDWVFVAQLPGESETIEHDLVYRVRARDAVTRDYQVTVSATPTIRVKKLDFEYPAYTGLAPETKVDTGEIEVPEGTRVRLAAEANYDIRAGYLEFDPRLTPSDAPRLGANLPLQVNLEQPRDATLSFLARLLEDRSAPAYQHYWLRYSVAETTSPPSVAGTTRYPLNPDPILYGIRVIADQVPEAEILQPDRDWEVAENVAFPFEVRAVDPDYGLTRVEMHWKCNTRIGQKTLMTQAQTGQFSSRGELVPQQLGWSAGETWTLQVVAWDNHRDHRTGDLAAQRGESRARQIKITKPVRNPPKPQTPPESPAEDSQKPGSNPGKGEQGQGEQGEGEQGQGTQGEGQQGKGEQGKEEQGKGEQGKGEQGEGEQGEGEQGEGEQGEGEQGKGEQGKGEQGKGEQGKGEQGKGEQGKGEQGEGEQGKGEQGKGEQGKGEQGKGEQGKGEQGKGEQGKGEQGEGEQGKGEQGEGEQGQGEQGEGEQGKEAGPPPPNDGASDGELIRRIQAHLEQKKGENRASPTSVDPQGNQPLPKTGQEQVAEGGPGQGDPTGESTDPHAPGEINDASPPPDRATPPRQPSSISGNAEAGPESGAPAGAHGQAKGGAEPRNGKPSDQRALGGTGEGPDQGPLENTGETLPDEPNLQYTQQAVELVLDALKDREHHPDPELLNELGWKQDDVRRFLDRWENLRKSAREAKAGTADVEWKNALRSLGLAPEGRLGQRKGQDSPQVQEDHVVPPLPAQYRHQYREFKKGGARRPTAPQP